MNKITSISRFIKYIILLLPLMVFISGCDDSTDPTSINIFSYEDDVKLGKQLDSIILSDAAQYPLLNSAAANKYVQDMVDAIIKSPEVKRDDVFVYTIKIIHRDDIINAFAAPGGYMYVYTGLIKFLDNEATLAGVLAHEVAHAERRHATQRMTKQYGYSFLIGLLLGDNPSQWEELAGNLLGGLALLKNSRDDESEADEYSFKYLESTKWYAGSIKYFFEKIKANEDSGLLGELTSTHPTSDARKEAVEKMITDAGLAEPGEYNLFSKEYEAFKKTLPQ